MAVRIPTLRATRSLGLSGRSAAGAHAPLVIGDEPAVLQHVLAVTAAAGVEPSVVPTAAAARPGWHGAPVVLVTADQAAQVAELALPRRAEVYLVGEMALRAELEGYSAPIGAAVVTLPDGAAWLTTAVADVTGRGGGSVVSVVGGSGGVGASTFAAALAVASTGRGGRAALVDLDPLGGGLDLLMGLEDAPGWRWPELASAQGHLADLVRHLPQAAEVAVLACARGVEADVEIGQEAVRSVLTSAARQHDLVVVDLPRAFSGAAREALRSSDRVMVVCGSDVRAISATSQLLDRVRISGGEPELVVRGAGPGSVEPHLVADALGVTLVGVVPDEPVVRRAAADGEPPGRSPRSALGRTAGRVVDSVRSGRR